MKVLVVGQAPAAGSRLGAPALDVSSSGDRLERLLGLQPGELVRRVDTLNLLDRYPGPATEGQSGDGWDHRTAKEAASTIVYNAWDVVVLLGVNVARAVGKGHMELLSTEKSNGVLFAVLPHPSGASRWWNDPQNRHAARRFVRDELPQVSQGLFE